MAETLLSGRLAGRHPAVWIRSAGTLAGQLSAGLSPPAEVIGVLAARGHDVSGHRSRGATPGDLARADLVLGMAREHVRHAAVLLPEAWPRSFTLLELLRRGREVGPRAPAEPLGDWLARAAYGRDRRELLGRSQGDDLADPTGGPVDGYEATASLLDQLTHELTDLCWPQ